MSNIKLYDTVKDNQTGNRFRVTEVISEGGSLVATLKMLDENGKVKKGRGRKMGVEALEKGYTRIDLPEVTVRKIDDLSEEERKVVKVFGKKDKDAQNENQSLTGLSEEKVEEALTASTFGGEKEKPKPHTLNDTFEAFKGKQRSEDFDVLKAECISLKEERARLQREVIDLKKTISKMKQEHEAEIRELGDELMEAKAEANAMRKRKDEVLEERARCVESLDSDSIAFERILSLAGALQRNAQTGLELARIIQAETEGRI